MSLCSTSVLNEIVMPYVTAQGWGEHLHFVLGMSSVSLHFWIIFRLACVAVKLHLNAKLIYTDLKVTEKALLFPFGPPVFRDI